MQPVIETSKYTVINNLRTGNIIIDTILSITIMVLINQLLLKTRNMDFSVLKNIFSMHSNKKSIKFICNQSHTFRGKVILDSSDTYRAILHYIKANLKNEKTKSLHKLLEYHSASDSDDEYDSDSKNTNNTKETIYFANQYGSFEIQTPLTKDLYFDMYKTRLEKAEGNMNTGTPSYKYTLNVYSYKKTLKELQNTIDVIHNIYRKYIENKYNKNNYIFMYMGVDNNYNLKYKTYPFHTTCNLDKIYFNEKDKIINQINFFIENKQWYLDKGKPYTLGICTYGPPGCGKTSFEKALAKKLNRHLIIVDFSRIRTQNEADEIFFSEKINGKDIPYEKRIYLFPDIDRMTDILNKRKRINDDNIGDFKNKSAVTHDTDEKEMLKTILKEVAPSSSSLMKSKDVNNNDTPLNLSKVLNILDGIPERTGQIIIMSTNHPDMLDDALLRPGRVDCMIEFRKASSSSAKKIIKNFYAVENFTYTEEKTINLIHEKYTPAELFKKCSEQKTIKALVQVL